MARDESKKTPAGKAPVKTLKKSKARKLKGGRKTQKAVTANRRLKKKQKLVSKRLKASKKV